MDLFIYVTMEILEDNQNRCKNVGFPVSRSKPIKNFIRFQFTLRNHFPPSKDVLTTPFRQN